MLDIGWAELFVIGVLILLVTGPRDLPKVLYEIGRWVRRARAMAREFQGHVDGMMREVELEELRKEAQRLRSFNLRDEVNKTLDPTRADACRPEPGGSESGPGGTETAQRGQASPAGASKSGREADGQTSASAGLGATDWLDAGLDGADQAPAMHGVEAQAAGYPFTASAQGDNTGRPVPGRAETGRADPGQAGSGPIAGDRAGSGPVNAPAAESGGRG